MRHRFMLIGALLVALLALAACGGPAAEEEAPMAEAPAADMSDSPYGEAPMLAEMVAAGELPPVEERLPVEPVVVPVVDSIGQYGGTWHTRFVVGRHGQHQDDCLRSPRALAGRLQRLPARPLQGLRLQRGRHPGHLLLTHGSC